MEIITHRVKIFYRNKRQEEQKFYKMKLEFNRKRENIKIKYGEKENSYKNVSFVLTKGAILLWYYCFVNRERGRYHHMEQQNLPKNIRQIGQAGKNPKIYIEDYVITYARKLAKQTADNYGLAVLLGKLPQKEDQPIFVSGAVAIRNYFPEQGVIFSNEVWSGIYEQIRKYFMDLEIMGLIATRKESEDGIPDRLKRIHLENFPGEDRIFFLYDSEEKEETFYRTTHRQLVKQNGYYIYYEKNESMQNYMVDTLGMDSEECEYEDLAMEHVRNVIASKGEPVEENKKMIHLMYAASTALAAVVLVIGTTMLSNYDKMNNMEQTLNHISNDVTELNKDGSNLLVETLNGNKDKTNNKVASKETGGETKDKNLSSDDLDKKDNKEEKKENVKTDNKDIKQQTQKEDKQKEEGKKAVAGKAARYYIVKKGDTLVTISGKLYDSDEYIETIQKINGIEDKDVIYEGQKLLLP